jgi:hypothetical protein
MGLGYVSRGFQHLQQTQFIPMFFMSVLPAYACSHSLCRCVRTCVGKSPGRCNSSCKRVSSGCKARRRVYMQGRLGLGQPWPVYSLEKRLKKQAGAQILHTYWGLRASV